MKMRKLLATAVAATVAVTSLATVASAAEKPFPMGHSKGEITYLATNGGKEVSLVAEEGKTLGLSNGDAKLVINYDGSGYMTVDNNDKVDTIPATVDKIVMKVTGIKGTKSNSAKTYSYELSNNGTNFSIDLAAEVGYNGQFVAAQFVEITNITFEVSGKSTTYDSAVYNWISSGDDKIANSWGSNVEGALSLDWSTSSITWDGSDLGNALRDAGNAACYSWGKWDAKSTSVEYPFMEVTGKDDLGRQEIELLSASGAWGSDGYWGNENDDSNQSYEGDDTTKGTTKVGFSGLSTQVADFFNKQTNGTITFKFTAPAAASGSSDWVTGGIPSTQTGVKTVIAGSSTNDFALFFNYRQTGSLQAVTALDKNAGTVTFDITNVLDTLGGQTMGVLDNIWYGLATGITYENVGTGLYVESVTLAYDEDADVEADIEDDAEIEDDTTVEEDDDVALEDDADEEEAPVEDDADEETDGDVIVETEDDDANPGTGVALAVVPALVAAAAVVVSKKRS